MNKVKSIEPVNTLEQGSKSTILKNRKEKHFYKQLSIVAIDKKGRIAEPVQARFYFNERGNGLNPVYCCIWVHSERLHTSGGGRAGGCGYDKESQALESALIYAGIELESPIGGVGSSASEEALLVIAEYLGFEHYKILRAHG